MLAVALTTPFIPLATPSASAAVRIHKLVNMYDGRCMDANFSNGSFNGMRVDLWDCNGSTSQQWSYGGDGPIRNVRNGKCLDAAASNGDYNGVPVELWDCNGGTNQTWYLGRFTKREILSPWDHKCIDADVVTSPDVNGAKLQMWTCNGSHANQGWNGLL